MAREYEVGLLTPDNNLTEWDDFVEESPQGSLFCSSWWLSRVAPKAFGILTVRRAGSIVAGLPMAVRRALGCTFIHMPPLTPALGVLVHQEVYDQGRRWLNREIEIVRELARGIPSSISFSTCCHPRFRNWLPFYWEGFRQTSLYTYLIPDISDPEKVIADFERSKHKNIKRAQKIVEVREGLDADSFYDLHRACLKDEGKRISYSRELFLRIHREAVVRNCGRDWYAVDSDGSVHGAIFVVFDHRRAYYLISAIPARFRWSGATSLLLRNAIVELSTLTHSFDFEGSMVPAVEQSFRRFGARQTQYFEIRKGIDPRTLGRIRNIPRGVWEYACMPRKSRHNDDVPQC